MYTDIFTEVGFSPNEAKIYESLLEQGKATVSRISKKTGIHRRNIYDAINRLLEKGVVFQIVGAGDNLFEPVAPEKLLEVIEEKRMKLNAIMPDLNKMFTSRPLEEATYIYKGVEGFKNYLRDVLRRGDDIDFIGAKGGWFDPRMKSFLDGFLRDAKKKGIKYRHLFDYEVKDYIVKVPQRVGKPYKFLPKEYSTKSMIEVTGDRVVFFNGAGLAQLQDDMTLFIITSQVMADSFRTWFQFMWDKAEE